MLTSLSVVHTQVPKGINRLFNKIRRDKVNVKIDRARGVYIKQVTYTSYNNKVKIEKIDSIIGSQRKKLLCNENLELPKMYGYKRFSSNKFSARLCTNMAIYILQKCENSEKLKIGIYDIDANSADCLKHIFKYCSDITVVTENSEPYKEQISQAMDEFGATAMLTNVASSLSECDFIIAPSIIEKNIPTKNNVLILTNETPKVHIKGLVYYKYYFKMPNGFDKIKPNDIDEEYFCSALYTLESQYELGTIVPTVCRNYSSSQTVASLCAYINRKN